jgi:membrane-associated phospholipid phosphatase
MPFVAWSIVPYWSLNLFYAAALFVPACAAGVHTLGRRLLTAQVVAVACFALFPLRSGFTRPPTDGVPGWLFEVLLGFDLPFNQAPSLHITLLVILWATYAPALPRAWRPALHLWFGLIGVSVLTTYQHHVVDVPAGALLGAWCLWLWPDPRPDAAAREPVAPTAGGLLLGGAYAAAALACGLAAWAWGGAAAWLPAWLGVALGAVAANYLVRGPRGFQKDARGGMPWAVRALLAPYLVLARVSAWCWNLGHPRADWVIGPVHVGSLPRPGDRWSAVVDLCAELPVAVPASTVYHGVPCLDLLPLDPAALRRAAQAIEAARLAGGRVLVCCALGRSRSVAAVVAWLLLSGRAADLPSAIAQVRMRRRHAVLRVGHRRALEALLACPA